MTFSDFAKVLHRYCNREDNKPDFVKKLVTKIMGGQPGRAHAGGGYQNPMCEKDDHTLLNYYNGKRSISPKDASIIYSRIKPEKFEKYIMKQCTPERQREIVGDFLEIEDLDEIEEIKELENKNSQPKICAMLFVSIIRELAEK